MRTIKGKNIFTDFELLNIVATANAMTQFVLDKHLVRDFDQALTHGALISMFRIHAGQKTRIGEAYTEHTTFVGDLMLPDSKRAIIGFHHDAPEQSNIDQEHYERMGHSPDTVEAIFILKKKDGAPYFDYMTGVVRNPLTRPVKRVDAYHNNLDSRHVEPKTEKERVKREARRAAYLLYPAFAEYVDDLEASGGQDAVNAKATISDFLSQGTYLLQLPPEKRIILLSALERDSTEQNWRGWLPERVKELNRRDELDSPAAVLV